MSQFDIDQQLRLLYRRFPEGDDRPVIGVTSNYVDGESRLAEAYYKQVVAAGGVPVLLPPLADRHSLVTHLSHIDGLLLTGGGDVNPLFSGEEPSPLLHSINGERDLPELLLTRLAYNRQLPMLGICRGMQVLATALGGTVAQDISLDQGVDHSIQIKHSQQADRSVATHSVKLRDASTLYNIYKEQQLFVNSFHHQTVSEPGPCLCVSATAPDGAIEGMESSEMKSIVGVQWHPECLGSDGLPLFKWLVDEARHYREACRLHSRIITLDSHCDTPMFFNRDSHREGIFQEGAAFTERTDRLLVDLHKMTDGRQDATIMVAYLPQSTPKEIARQYADDVFTKIEQIVAANSEYVGLARNKSDILANKLAGRKSILLGIENGLALQGDPANVEYFARRGVVYITLCHNGDNDLCDSAKGQATHNGLSDLGMQVVEQMNLHNVVVDLSHASEKSFYDAIEVSRRPIVCSHSSCRALCDHPRNLTDDQMRSLARHGGVMQVTAYSGFLRRHSEATILDLMAHVDHAVEVMGIDHVGLGTDFDGDGGIRGMASSAELLQFTRQLLSRRYSHSDIALLWGENFLRVIDNR